MNSVYNIQSTARLMKLQALLFAVFVVLATCHNHQYSCVFDHDNQDLRGQSAKANPDIPIHPPGQYLNGRLLSAPSPVRAPLRMVLDTTYFNTGIIPGVNGAATTTQTKVNFVLRSMYVTQAFYQTRLQVGQVGIITAPSYCVDFEPTSTAQSSGYSNADLVIFVQYLTDASKTYGATGKSCKYFSGSANPDYTLQQGRPTVGRIIFNTYTLVDQENSLTNRLFQSITSTALHQTMHILGFDSTLYSSFLDPSTGSPYTYAVLTSGNYSSNRPATSVMTTPNVVAWAKSFFGCNNLTGMPVQNQDGTGAGAGSHWQRVAMYDELMTATIIGSAKYFSGLTYAFLMDTGWYTVDNSFAQTSNYGYQQGCSFIVDACYSSTSFNEFCNAGAMAGNSYCNTNYYGQAICSTMSSAMTDSCGMYLEHLSCVDPATIDPNNYLTYSKEVYGTTSFCFDSTLGTAVLPSNLLSRCYPYVCNTNSITITIGTHSITCLSAETGVQKTLSGLNGYLTCPSFTSFCTMSRKTCSNFCNQNGYCTGGICNCYTGYYGSTCTITNCTTGQFYQPVTSTCVTNCLSGYYGNIYSKSCQPCKPPCSQCVGNPTSCSGCATLNGQVQYFYENACYSACPSSTYATGSLNCVPCNATSAFCSSCAYSSTNCTACQAGLYLSQPVSGNCIASCGGTGYNLQDEVNMVCVTQCPSNQYAPGNGSCILCSVGTFNSGGNCVSNCTTGYYANTLLRACMLCDTSCKTCDGSYPQNCTSCILTSGNPYLLLKMCWSICPKGFYADPSGSCTICPTQLQCIACTYNNDTLTAQCTSCQYNYFFQANTSICGTSCLSNQYRNTWNNSCSSCDAGCTTCNGPTSYSCTSCTTNFYLLTNSTGGYCLSSCPTIGYIQVGTNCQSCDSTCSACNGQSASQCFNCSSGYYLSGGYCRYVCPSGTYPNTTNSQCITCDLSCSYCFGGTNSSCTSCATGLYLYNFTCTNSCPNGMIPNQWNVCFEGWLWTGKLIIAALLLVFAL